MRALLSQHDSGVLVNSHFFLFVLLANRVGTLVSQLAVGAFLSPEVVGIWAVALGINTIALFFQASDFSRIPLQAGPDRSIVDATLARWLLLAWLATAGGLVLTTPHLIGASYGPLLALLALCPLRMLANRRMTKLSADGATTLLGWCTAAEGLVRTVVLVSAILLGMSGWSFVAVEWCAVITQLAMARPRLAGQAPDRSGGWRLPRHIVRQLASTAVVCLLVATEGNLVAILISRSYSEAAAGSYFFALRFANQIIIILYPLMLLESLPRLISLREDKAAFVQDGRKMMRRYWLLATTMGIAVAVAGPLALHLIWGKRWEEAAHMLQVMGFAVIFRAMFVFAKVQMEALGAFYSILLLSLVDLGTILAILILAGVLHWSPITMVGVLCLESLIILILANTMFTRRLRASPTAVGGQPQAV